MGGAADEFPLLSGLGLYAADIRGDGMGHSLLVPLNFHVTRLHSRSGAGHRVLTAVLPCRQLFVQCTLGPTLWQPEPAPGHPGQDCRSHA